MQRLVRVLLVACVLVCISPLLAVSQGIQQTPYSAADAVRRDWSSVSPDFTASHSRGLHGSSVVGSDSITISSGMFQGILPSIPNLQLGYNYSFGPRFRAGSASVDYLLPFKLGADSTVYGEAHGEFQSLSIYQPDSPNNSMELCLGGGYRKMFGNHTLIGLHGFYDKTKLSGTWYSSGSAGFEMAAMVPGHDAIDLNFNWYGQAFDSSMLSNSLGFNPGTGQVSFGNANYDFQAGYSHELYDGGPDLRLSVTGYKFDTGSCVYGFYGGAELKSRDGVFVLKYDVGYDNTSQTYQSVAAFVNTGFQLENLIAGKSPFVMPKPVFQSPRNITKLSEAKVNRNWRHNTQAATLALLSATSPGPRCPLQTITIINNTSNTITLYMNFNTGQYADYPDLVTSFPGWTATSNPTMITTTVPSTVNNNSITINFPVGVNKTAFAISVNNLPQTGCCSTLMEFTLCDQWTCCGNPIKDTYDVSLVNGGIYSVTVTPTTPAPNPLSPNTPISLSSVTGNSNNPGVYGYGWTGCNTLIPPLACTPTAGEGHPTGAGGVADPPCNLIQNGPTSFTVTLGPLLTGLDPSCIP